jgi:hypothetical protein
MLQINRIWSIIFAALFALTFTLSGCGGSKDDVTTTDPVIVITTPTPAPTTAPTTTAAPEGNNYVQYQGTTLVVLGKYYYRIDLDTTKFAGGQIIVRGLDEKDAEYSSLLEQLSLEKITPTGTGAFTVKVPRGFEEQWVRALSDQASVKYAELDGIMTTQ